MNKDEEWIKKRMVKLDCLLMNIELTLQFSESRNNSSEDTLQQIKDHIATFKGLKEEHTLKGGVTIEHRAS